ncbi:FadR family transcriptional regulator [Roseibium sp. CAU 1637]|uniref:FadR family transcriptional regulator n=1 Tax=Roseibium limicola TaxID=2816037 RepID=A0A939EJY1_9HYPH|nr:FadR/GntR family transcriptional regulator [Roseibium limicola]MBO0343991.1 FadR family transcriptional regulator [Roseibium limicola]
MSAPQNMSLTEKIQTNLGDKIRGGAYHVGEKLPREKDLVSTYGVSRTVVREALAQLRAEGLIEIKHGVGAFVCSQTTPEMKIPFLPDNLQKRSDLLELLELRKGVEIEAAGLAALRRSPAQNERIQEAFHDFKEALRNNSGASEKDFELHRRIAEATNNRFYLEFLDYISRQVTVNAPRSLYGGEQSRRLDQLNALEDEHRQLVEAIREQDPEKSRSAMRQHLKASEDRFMILKE